MTAIFLLIDQILGFYMFIVVAMIIMSWLYSFGVVPHHNQVINQIMGMLHRLTEPVLGRIRTIIPSIGGLDLSALALLFAISFLRNFIRFDLVPMLS